MTSPRSSLALVIGADVGDVRYRAAVLDACVRMHRFLEDRGARVLTAIGDDATREGVLARFEVLTRLARRGDCVLVYYAGHGRTLYLDSRPYADVGTAPPANHQLLITRDVGEARLDEVHGVMSFELGARLRRLATTVDNLTLILDCGHCDRPAGVANGDLRAWIERSSAELPTPLSSSLNAETPSPAEYVRLVATTSLERSAPYERRDGVWGLAFTDALLEALAEPMLDGKSWGQLLGWIRVRVWERRPGQRPDMVGPRHRRPFSVEESAPAPGVFLGQRTRDAQLVIEHLTLGTIELGEEFALMPVESSARRKDAVATAEVVEVLPSRARLEIRTSRPGCMLPRVFNAIRTRRKHTPRRVAVLGDDPHGTIAESVQLWGYRCVRLTHADLCAIERGASLTIRDAAGVCRFAIPASRPEALGELRAALSHLASWTQLRRALERHQIPVRTRDCEVRWARVSGGRHEWLDPTRETLVEGDEIFVQVLSIRPEPIYVTVLRVRGDRSIHRWTRGAIVGAPAVHGVPRVIGTGEYEGDRGEPITWPPTLPRDNPIDELLVITLANDGGKRPRVETTTLDVVVVRYKLIANSSLDPGTPSV